MFNRTFQIIVVLTGFSLPAWGLAQGSLQLKMESLQEISVVAKDGKKQTTLVPATKVVPGTEVIYVITYRNTGEQPAVQPVITNAVPKQLTYKGGTAAGNKVKFEVSVDGGKAYGVLPSLKVAGSDGNLRPAQPADVTHLRWTLASSVAAGTEGQVSYRAVLK